MSRNGGTYSRGARPSILPTPSIVRKINIGLDIVSFLLTTVNNLVLSVFQHKSEPIVNFKILRVEAHSDAKRN